MGVDPEKFVVLHHKLEALKKKHAQIDAKIEELSRDSNRDDLAIHRLKREKLSIKDEMAQIEADMVPDIIA